MRFHSLPLVLALLVPAGPAAAEGEGRYRMEKTEGGVVRLDTETGEIALCLEKDGQIACRMAADERAAFERELDLLTRRVEALEQERGTARERQALPTDEEIDRTMSVMERMMQRFMGIVRSLEGDTQKSGEKEAAPGAGAVPDRT